MRNTVFLALLLAAGLIAAPARAQQNLQPQEGEVFPELQLPTLDGEPGSLAAYRGKKVLLMQFASW